MGTKYSSQTISGYNSSPPSDDGSQTAANQITWSKHKTKLGDPLKTLIEAVNSTLVTALDTSVRAVTSNETLTAADHWKTIQCSVTTAGITVSLGDAATMAAGYIVSIHNQASSTGTVTVNLATAANTINTVTNGSVLIPAGAALEFVIASPATGYVTRQHYWPALNASSIVNKMVQIGEGAWLYNTTLTASVGASALTVALKTQAGTDPSATDPSYIGFRNATAGTGDFTVLKITAATNIVVSNGSTLGTVSGSAHRLYVVGFNDAGTFRLGVYNPYNATGPSIVGLDEGRLYSSTAEGGAGGADSAQTIYTGSAVTTKAMRILGYVESTQTSAGVWATTPSKVQLMFTGAHKTGDIVQSVYASSGGSTTSSGTYADVTGATVSVTPTNALHPVLVRFAARGICVAATANTGYIQYQLLRDAGAIQTGGVGSSGQAGSEGTMHGTVNFMVLDTPATASATTYKVQHRAVGNTSGTQTTDNVTLLAQEIFV